MKIGSLELLHASQALTLFNMSDPALRTGSAGEETAAQVNVEIRDASFDLVIMNPPFTREIQSPSKDGRAYGVHLPLLSLRFDASKADQRDMPCPKSNGCGLSRKPCYHGNATDWHRRLRL